MVVFSGPRLNWVTMPHADRGMAAGPDELHHMRILLVEDDEPVGAEVRAILEQDGYR